MGVKIRLGCLATLLVVLLAAMVFHRPILQRLFDDAYAKTTEKVAAALPVEEREAARALCEDLHICFKTHDIGPEHADLLDAFRTDTFDMLKNQEVTEEEARAHLERVELVLDTACGR